MVAPGVAPRRDDGEGVTLGERDAEENEESSEVAGRAEKVTYGCDRESKGMRVGEGDGEKGGGSCEGRRRVYVETVGGTTRCKQGAGEMR